MAGGGARARSGTDCARRRRRNGQADARARRERRHGDRGRAGRGDARRARTARARSHRARGDRRSAADRRRRCRRDRRRPGVSLVRRAGCGGGVSPCAGAGWPVRAGLEPPASRSAAPPSGQGDHRSIPARCAESLSRRVAPVDHCRRAVLADRRARGPNRADPRRRRVRRPVQLGQLHRRAARR